MDAALLASLAMACAPLVHPATVAALVTVESSSNPHAIGVVGGLLERQPRTLAEAIATAESLHRNGWSYSVGLAQINVRNFDRLGLNDRTAFDPCANLHAMQTVLGECLESLGRLPEQPALRSALSCYYSGNVTTGFADGYVHRIVAASRARPIRDERPP